MLLFSGSVFANVPEGKDPGKKLEREVRNLLIGYAMSTEKDLEATVLFTVNKEKEIVVLSVDTNDKALEYFVKSRLNYHKVQDNEIPEGRRYTIPVKIVA